MLDVVLNLREKEEYGWNDYKSTLVRMQHPFWLAIKLVSGHEPMKYNYTKINLINHNYICLMHVSMSN